MKSLLSDFKGANEDLLVSEKDKFITNSGKYNKKNYFYFYFYFCFIFIFVLFLFFLLFYFNLFLFRHFF